MIEVFTIISCFYFFGPGTPVPNHCSPDFYDSAFQSMEACEKKRKESFVYHDKRIPPTKGSMDTAGADVWNICVPKAELIVLICGIFFPGLFAFMYACVRLGIIQDYHLRGYDLINLLSGMLFAFGAVITYFKNIRGPVPPKRV